ncbi:MAG: hypothetical protein ACE5E7_19660, partial [Anaerolineae bacterium]
DSTEKLISLLDHALLNRDELGRFRMHPILRQLASEKLNSPNMSEVKEQALKRHSRFFADLVRSFEHDLQLGVGPAEVQAILPEQANLRAAWHHAVQTKQWQIIADCLDGAHYFYRRKGLFSEEASLVDDAIMALHATMAEDDAPLTALLARLLVVKAWGYLHSADFEKGIETAERVCGSTAVNRGEEIEP